MGNDHARRQWRSNLSRLAPLPAAGFEEERRRWLEKRRELEATTHGVEVATTGVDVTTTGALVTTTGVEVTTTGLEAKTTEVSSTTTDLESVTTGLESTTLGLEFTTPGGSSPPRRLESKAIAFVSSDTGRTRKEKGEETKQTIVHVHANRIEVSDT